VAVILVIIVIFALNARGKNGGESITITRSELIKTTELAGKVIPSDDADLAFEVGGTVSSVRKKVGDKVIQGESIVELDMSSTYADYLKAKADLAAAQAELANLSGGRDIQAKVTNSKSSAVQNIRAAYTTASDAIYNKVDQYFTNPRTYNPEILNAFKGLELRNRINQNRIKIGEILESWKKVSDSLTSQSYTDEDLQKAIGSLKAISAFLDDVVLAVNSFEANGTLTQTMIDKYKGDTATAQQNVDSAMASLISSEDTLRDTLSDVPVQGARVAAAEATLANYGAKLSKMTLRAPISGIISKQDAKVGEAVSANTNVVSIISGDYKIESYVPEVSVAGVIVGAKAKITLDAYGKDLVYDATISHIDPRETVRDGVSTYKTELTFNSPDNRILSGMTTNISIETMRKSNVLLVPERSIRTEDGKKFVYVKGADEKIAERQISTGSVDSKGNIEVNSGIVEGDSILLEPQK
jgi:multidrug efflux pump subunit AcrA (membrane-fusion protein)